MPSEIETRLREALDVEPAAEVGERLRAAVADGIPRRRRVLSWLGRGVGPALALVGAAAAVTVLALLVIATPGDPPAAPVPTTGVEAILRVVPSDPAASAEDSAGRLADILAGIRDSRGITGMTATQEGDRVRLFVPRTHDIHWARSLLTGLDTGVYDLSDAVIADRSLARVLEAVELPPAGPEPSRYYAVMPDADPGQSRLSDPFATSEEARASGLSADPRVARVASSVTLALADDPAPGGTLRFVALADPLVAPGFLLGARAEGRALILEIAREAVPAVSRRVAAADPDDLALVVSGGIPQELTGARFSGIDPAEGTLTFSVTGGAAGLLPFVGGGGLAASVSVEDSRPVGPPPARTGDRPAVLPSHFRGLTTDDLAGDPFRPRLDTVLRVVEAPWGGTVWSLWTYLTADGDELVTTIGPVDGAGTGGCPIAPDHPVLLLCGGGSGYQRDDVGRTMHGRVGPDVASVALVLADGREFPAAIGNGFFLLVLPRDVSGDAELMARGDDGSVLERVGANAAGGLPRD